MAVLIRRMAEKPTVADSGPTHLMYYICDTFAERPATGPSAGDQCFCIGGAAAPSGYLLCDGAAVSRTTYSDLFAVVSTKYGVGDGSTTFNLPNLKGRLPVGLDAAISDFDDRGKTGGEKTHVLATAEIPAHTHVQDSHNHTQNAHSHVLTELRDATTGGSTTNIALTADTSSTLGTKTTGSTTPTNQAATATNQNAGGGGAHENMPPYVIVNYIIKT